MARGAVLAQATLQERVSVVETKVDNIEEKIDDLKSDVKEMHDCLDQTRDTVLAQLDKMTDEYRANASKYYEHAEELNKQQTAQHDQLAGKISELEKFKQKWLYMIAGGIAVAGWVSGHLNTLVGLIK